MIAIPNMSKPKSCWECFNADCDHWGEHGYDNSADCPLIDIVTCGECKHAKFKIEDAEYVKCKITQLFVNKSDFCPDGERK